jgi:hypothetical protein
MPFQLSEMLTKVLSVIGLVQADVDAKIAELAADYPDAQTQATEFQAWLAGLLTPALTPATAAAMALQAWQELAGGHPGYGQHHGGVA